MLLFYYCWKSKGSKLGMSLLWYYIRAARDVVLNMSEITLFFQACLLMHPNTDGTFLPAHINSFVIYALLIFVTFCPLACYQVIFYRCSEKRWPLPCSEPHKSLTHTYAFFIVLTCCSSVCTLPALEQSRWVLHSMKQMRCWNRLFYQQSVVDKNHFNEWN